MFTYHHDAKINAEIAGLFTALDAIEDLLIERYYVKQTVAAVDQRLTDRMARMTVRIEALINSD